MISSTDSSKINFQSANSRVGLIAGSGRLPLIFAQSEHMRGRVVAVAHLDETDPTLADWVEDIHWVRLGQFKRVLTYLAGFGVRDVVLVGGIRKARIWHIRPDMLALQMVFRLRHLQDDMLLRGIADQLQQKGFLVRGITEYLPELLAPVGQLSRRSPTPLQWEDIRFGWSIAKELGRLDIGQGVVVKEKVVVAVEAMEGTDAMIQRAGALAFGGRRGKGLGALVKVVKPQQDLRLDLPTIGPQTIENLHRAGIGLLVIEAGGVIILDPEVTFKAVDESGLVLLALRQEDVDHGYLAMDS
ncbi:MAG: UDP-2,3-diacylglucosamine diphosphatase LpxI [Magnetococcus sp. DMHC-6]